MCIFFCIFFCCFFSQWFFFFFFLEVERKFVVVVVVEPQMNKLDLLFEDGESFITLEQLHRQLLSCLESNGFKDVTDDQVVVLVALVMSELDEEGTGRITKERMEKKMGESEVFKALVEVMEEGGVMVDLESHGMAPNSPLVEEGNEEKGKEKEDVGEIEITLEPGMRERNEGAIEIDEVSGLCLFFFFFFFLFFFFLFSFLFISFFFFSPFFFL